MNFPSVVILWRMVGTFTPHQEKRKKTCGTRDHKCCEFHFRFESLPSIGPLTSRILENDNGAIIPGAPQHIAQ